MYKHFSVSFVCHADCLQCQSIGIEAKACNHTQAHSREHRLMAEFLTGMHIGDMHLYHWCGNRFDGITNSYRGMGLSPRIENDPITDKAGLLYFIDELTLYIRLVVSDLNVGVNCLQPGQIIVELLLPVNTWLSHSKQIEIGPVNNLYSHSAASFDDDLLFCHFKPQRYDFIW